MQIVAPVPKNPDSKAKKTFARQFYTLYTEKFSNMRPLCFITFPRTFLRLDTGLQEVGAKSRLNKVNK